MEKAIKFEFGLKELVLPVVEQNGPKVCIILLLGVFGVSLAKIKSHYYGGHVNGKYD
jgi:hypothetical protein